MKRSVLVTDDVHHLILQSFEQHGLLVDYKPNIKMEEVRKIIPQYFGLIINSKIGVDKALVDDASQLKFIGRVGSGMEHVDLAYCKEKGVACFRSPEGNCNAVAEHIIGMLLALNNNLITSNNQLKSGVWKREENRGIELRGKTIGIIGFGYTGQALAKKLSGFEMKILAYDKYVKPISNEIVSESSLSRIQEEADIISFHVPYNCETHHYFDKIFINNCLMKPIVVNSSRGAIINTLDVLEALKENKIKGLCLDVFEDEPFNKEEIHLERVYKELFSFENVIVSPHIAGWTVTSKRLLAEILRDKISEFMEQIN